jgi:hypothetical protein
MLDPPLTQSDEKHIRDAWIWAASIIAIAALLTLSGLVAESGSQSSLDAEWGKAGARDAASLAPVR